MQLTIEEINRTIKQNKWILKDVESLLKNNKEGLKFLGWSKSSIDNIDDCNDPELIELKRKLGVKVARVTGRW
ncbi:MAG: hypothetical protein ACOCM4_02165 [Acetivibrio ethanolgignens]